ncbi:unnamed protein product [Clonostachys solani]|uniref:Uncharacterized protein n=1 Tax=Clonostachys solani TaxID=160281 RepID=A0A9P0EJD2_9HYPO|nr:unnamed protein product [Clonostachys solani]
MAAAYKQFLAAPSSSLLADSASLHYIPTTTTFSGAAEIIKHLNSVQKQLKIKKQDILTVIEGESAAVIEVDTTLEFITSGGAYLPGLDDNFLTDRVAYLPITHIVFFNAAGKIAQIRLQWDQGALLKQIEIIGKSGRNWPIKDNREQIKLIQSCQKVVAAGTGAGSIPQNQNETLNRTRGNSTHALRDPHATLHMMASREEIENESMASVVSPFGGKRPQQRSFTQILGDEPEEQDSPSVNRHSTVSPAKAGQGKNFQPMRLFDREQEDPEDEDTPKGRPSSQYIRPNPRKFQHFDFADGSDPQDAPEAGVTIDKRQKSKHDSQWDFEDFVTPSKPKPSKGVRYQDVRHWDTDREALKGETPAPPAGKGRRDAESHFELQDDGERVVHPNNKNMRQRGSVHNDQLNLYKDRTLQEGASPEPNKALGNITNLAHRGKDFDPHFTMTDDPSPEEASASRHVPEGRQKAVKMMGANWSAYDESPKQKENQAGAPTVKDDSRIHIAGDGMGGRKGTNRDWLYGEEGEQPAPKPAPTRKGNLTSQQRSFWDF